MREFLISGMLLGLAAGLSPGPLAALVVAQSLRYGSREGMKVALAPLVSDLPIVVASLLVLSRLSDRGPVMAVVGLAGGLFVAWLGYESLRVRAGAMETGGAAARSFSKAVALNLLNPHVYLFWVSIGGPMILKGLESGAGAAVFVLAFYACLVGSKVAMAMVVGRSRAALGGRGYVVLMRALGAMLAALAAWMIGQSAWTLAGLLG